MVFAPPSTKNVSGTGAGLEDTAMRHGTARGPSNATDTASAGQAKAGQGDDSVDFLEGAAHHLREAGYTVELEFDHEAEEAYLSVDGIEVRFVRHLPAAPIKH